MSQLEEAIGAAIESHAAFLALALSVLAATVRRIADPKDHPGAREVSCLTRPTLLLSAPPGESPTPASQARRPFCGMSTEGAGTTSTWFASALSTPGAQPISSCSSTHATPRSQSESAMRTVSSDTVPGPLSSEHVARRTP